VSKEEVTKVEVETEAKIEEEEVDIMVGDITMKMISLKFRNRLTYN
jgi:hypothetical protein